MPKLQITPKKTLIRIKNLPENDIHYTKPTAFRIAQDNGLWVDGNYRCSTKPSKTRTIEITWDGNVIHIPQGALDAHNLKEFTGQKGFIKCLDPARAKKEQDKLTAKDPGFRWL